MHNLGKKVGLKKTHSSQAVRKRQTFDLITETSVRRTSDQGRPQTGVLIREWDDETKRLAIPGSRSSVITARHFIVSFKFSVVSTTTGHGRVSWLQMHADRRGD